MKDGWKITSIVFMLLFVIETIYLIWAFNASTEYYERESECAYNICEVGTEHEAFAYDVYGEICYCYNDNEIVYQKYMG